MTHLPLLPLRTSHLFLFSACGKTKLSLELAGIVGGEIISADSMQVYRGMDIGTAKASVEERALIA
ncbi:MAG: hypothetical protein WCQ90_15610, partial [Deltaproteobacteria bacterium]